jgi:FkbM family methyltransferase
MKASTTGKYYKEEQAVFLSFKNLGFEPKVIFDVGSSHSGWSYTISSLFPKAEFHLFEPLADLKPFYRENTARVLQARPDFIVHKIAVGATDGKIRLFSDAEGYGASTLISESRGDLQEDFEVPIFRLDTLTPELPNPDILKMDVQGAELEVLQGAQKMLRHVQIIQLEAWFQRGYGARTPLLHEVTEFLEKNEFRLVEFGGGFYTEIHELYSIDAFFARVDLLEKLGPGLGRSSFTG